MKRCTRCGVERNDERKHSWCRPCAAANAREWNAANPERVRAIKAKYYAANQEKAREAAQKYRRENPEKVRDAAAAYHQANRDTVLAKQALWRKSNPEKSRAATLAWRSRNVDRVKSMQSARYANDPDLNRIYAQRRRQRENMAPGRGITTEQWSEMVGEFGSRCAYCNAAGVKLVMEHMDPLSGGGAHDVDNIVPACRECNARKFTLTALEFLTGFRLDRKAAVAI